MIRLENVTKYYPVGGKRNYVLKEVTLEIPSGVNVGILGRNGAGKSTLLRILGGIDFPQEGRVLSDKRFSWPMALSGGYQGSLSGRDNARFVCRVYGKSEEEVEQALTFIHDFSELGEYFFMPVKTYSSGMRSRLGFAMSMAFDFDYYLIDETLSVGDKHFKEKCETALAELRERRNILMVGHDMGAIRRMCDAGIVLEAGELTWFDDVSQAVEMYGRL